MRDSEQMYPVVFTAAIIQRNLRLSEAYNTNVRFFNDSVKFEVVHPRLSR